MKRDSLLPYALIIAALITAVLLFVSRQAGTVTGGSGGKSGSTDVSKFPQPPPTCHYCLAHLLNASPEEIGRFAVQYAIDWGEVLSGTPQVMLSRLVTWDDYLTLGLGCPPSKVTFEEPPLALVILKGDLLPVGPGLATFPDVKYIAYVFDLWADAPTSKIWSADGVTFRIALNDPSLPDGNSSMPMVCPTPLPHKITQHYGEEAPPVDVPTPPDAGSPTPAPPAPSSTIPLPIPTTGR